jgi:ubiquinone/menaquinone biosynthesis C-methylase UbiE
VAAAQAGAKLAIGIDISGESIERARRQAEAKGVGSSTVFIQADCEDTRLPAGSVDLIYCCGMLHHLDLSYAFPEMRRIMTPGAKAFGYEALNYNPLIKLYRKLTPELRTAWEKEHILSLKDLEFARRFFEVEDVRYWNLTVMAAPHLPFLAPAFAAIDAVLTKIPLVQLMSWIFTFELRKSLHLK